MLKAGSHQALQGSRRTWGEHASRALVLSSILFSSAFAVEGADYPAGTPAIPPGQEELIAAMLGQGAALPDGCSLVSGTAAYNTITARYSCRGDEIEFALVHPMRAGEEDVQTENFAIAQRSGAADNKLTDALVALVRSKEANFEWIWPAKDDVAVDDVEEDEDAF